MDKLKIYAMPIAALLILLAYWLVVRPMLANQTADGSAQTKK
jgi:flagellar biosynthesis/type III secretory pathway M-ring protein FliF/YscJ